MRFLSTFHPAHASTSGKLRHRHAGISAAVTICLLCGLTPWGHFASRVQAQTPSAGKVVLQVHQRDDGTWVGWSDDGHGRSTVEIPQSKEEIKRFADTRGTTIEWLEKPLLAVGDRAALASADASKNNTLAGESAPAPITTKDLPANASTPAKTDGTPSVAERTIQLERTIQEDSRRLEDLRTELTNPAGEYQQAETEFKSAEEELAAARARIAELKQSGAAEEVKAAEEAIMGVQTKHGLARQRFDLAIQTRKTAQEQISALEQKIQQDQQARDKLTGAVPPATPETKSPDQPATEAVTVQAAPAPVPAAVTGATNDVPAAGPAPSAGPAAAPPGPPAVPTGTVPPPTAEPGAAKPQAEVSAELVEAQQKAEQKKEEARVAEQEVQSITERIQTLDKTIALEQKLFEAGRQKADIAYKQQRALLTEYQEKTDAGATRSELQTLAEKRREAVQLFEKSRTEVAERTDRLDRLQTERTSLQVEEVEALKAAEEKRNAAVVAEEQVGTLKNPFSIHNMLQWMLDHGIRIGLILVGILVLRMMLRLSTRRFVDLMVKSGARGTPEEREDRAKTLVGVFHNAGSLAIMIGGILMICDEVGVAVGPLMGGAAVLGLAVAFGAQNLIRDYFYGFVILFENQYKINDVLKIGDISGQVERITLRMTVLRDLEGRVHFIPNGKIDSVTNMTHGWSRAVFEIGVAYKEDADRVMDVLMELARGLRGDPKMAPQIIDDPEMLGVDALGDSAVVLKFVIKTRPMKQWAVKRELLRRIKRRFDELGIEIPFPHRTVYHHHVDAGNEGNDGYENHRAA